MNDFLKIIDAFLDKEIEFDEFYKKFNDVYSSSIASDLPEGEFAFVDEINERLFFAAKDPSKEEQEQHNYMDQNQFKDWLSEKRKGLAS
jgi:hypothetical protein